MYNLLICDDEQDIVNALKIYLADEDYRIFEAFDGAEALKLVEKEEIHLVLMDIMMPVMDGLTAMVKIREISNVPIILLTAKGEDSDKILGLSVGADDYITKPFLPAEVSARVRSALRRYMQLGSGMVSPDVIRIGGIELNDKEKTVMVEGEVVFLTPTEFDILKLLMGHPGEVFAPADIYRKIWKEEPLGSESTVAVHIRHLREKLEINPAEPRYLKVIWGQGYSIKEPERNGY